MQPNWRTKQRTFSKTFQSTYKQILEVRKHFSSREIKNYDLTPKKLADETRVLKQQPQRWRSDVRDCGDEVSDGKTGLNRLGQVSDYCACENVERNLGISRQAPPRPP